VYFAGQITGVEGYMESASSGILAGIFASRELLGLETIDFPVSTMVGALSNYVSGFSGKDFQPMGANFGIVTSDAPELKTKIKDKALKKKIIAERALEIVREISARL
jgi:methylenetetrahydrofolate--tRNA-(uracil-5-)-methyltransferase